MQKSVFLVTLLSGCATQNIPVFRDGALQQAADAEKYLGRTAMHDDGLIVPDRYAFKVQGLKAMSQTAKVTEAETTQLNTKVKWTLEECGIDIGADAQAADSLSYEIEESMDAGLDENSWGNGDVDCCSGNGFNNCESETIVSIHKVKVTFRSSSATAAKAAFNCSALSKYFPQVTAAGSTSSSGSYEAAGWALVRTRPTWKVCEAINARK